ncbi:GMP synthetase [Petrocella atlantisensis]|uniref:GMP synthase [glutamine-hydrolyzing] n=1 Tax=Petrocella atlantisensis TaxID=2173034 RepID=A0A3P7S241_9FIRM|nr:glutamine-hydrolyzing GMP synthase [Petrocella atlantisensis]VDN48732.1 GMP synthetase [Petrocella atlantisensis]
MKHELIIVLDFGGQYNQLIARRVREVNVYAEVLSYETPIEEIIARNPKGIIFTGGPSVVFEENAPLIDKAIFDAGIPILGICYGSQLMGYLLGGSVARADSREYGKTDLTVDKSDPLFEGVDVSSVAWMSHTYYVSSPPSDFRITASTDTCPVAGMSNESKKLYAVQFHPEVNHTPEGTKMLKNFLVNICGCSQDWIMSDFAKDQIKLLKEKIGDKKVLCALSGGVDSSVAAMLIHKAVGKQLTCIFVDHGLLRKDEGDDVEKVFGEEFDMNLIRVNCEKQFLNKLAGVSDPETKRKIIGEEFIRVFEAEAKKIGVVDFLVQGTIYPDVIESGTKDAAVIKSHHNVGGLPEHVDFKEIIEPLRDLFKDEVRNVGRAVGIPEFLVSRQPFPGPGLAIRVIGDITKEKLDILREADYIFREEVKAAGISKGLGQYFAVLTNLKSVGVMGDERTYDYTVALRSVDTSDFMTADWSRIPHEILAKVSNRIVNEVNHVNRICYDITSKPPATIEWE